MADPIIRIDSTDGGASDTTCSGCGPGDGITAGTKRSGTGNGEWTSTTNFEVPNEAFTNVEAGHVLYVTDTATQTRNFHEITEVKNAGTATASVVVDANTPGVVESGLDWAIGGARASLFGSETMALFASGGDYWAGLIVELADGHDESWSTRQSLYHSVRAQIRGEAGASTRPKLTLTSNANSREMVAFSSYLTIKSLDITYDHPSNNSDNVLEAGADYISVIDVHFYNEDAGKAECFFLSKLGSLAHRCRIEGFREAGIRTTGSWTPCVVSHCFLKADSGHVSDCTHVLMDGNTNRSGPRVINSIFVGGDYGLRYDNKRDDTIAPAAVFCGNIFYDLDLDAIDIAAMPNEARQNILIAYNIFDTIGANAIEMGDTESAIETGGAPVIVGNAFRSITSNRVTPQPANMVVEGSITLPADPFVAAASGDFNLNDTAGGAVLRAESFALN